MSEREFNIRKSTKTVGQLYPILYSKDGQLIDGCNRIEADPGWRKETLEHIDSEEKILLARAISNWHRRAATAREKEIWINNLARIYMEEGLQVYGKTPGGKTTNEIMGKLMEELGICRQTVTTYLHQEYKQKGKGGRQGGPRVPASQAIRTIAKSRPRLAGDLVDRHREEVREELLNDPDFQTEVIQKVGKRVGRPSLALDVEDIPIRPGKGRGTKHIPEGYEEALQVIEAREPMTEEELEAQSRSGHLHMYPGCVCMDCPHDSVCMDMGLKKLTIAKMT